MGNWRSYDDAALYERVHAPHAAFPARDLVAVAGLAPGERVLDLGTGTGVVAAAARGFVGPDGLVVGADPSLGMLMVAAHVRPGPFVAAEALDLPFRNGTFHAVTAGFVLSQFRRYQTALFDVVRVLRPGGRLAASTWGDQNDEFRKAWFELIQTAIGKELFDDATERSAPWERFFSDRGNITEALTEAGLRHIKVERREYRFRYSLEDYIASAETSACGRTVREMLGEGWDDFCARARETFAERFPPEVNDFNEVWLAVGTKP